MKYSVRMTGKFKKDLKKAQKQGKDIKKLYDVVQKIAKGEILEKKYQLHELMGEYKGCMECHIEPDWLLIYEIFDDVLVLILNRVASHSELFK